MHHDDDCFDPVDDLDFSEILELSAEREHRLAEFDPAQDGPAVQPLTQREVERALAILAFLDADEEPPAKAWLH